VGLGGTAVNIIPFLDEAQAKLVDFYTTNIGNLSLGEQEMFLDEILGIANAKLAEEQAAFQRAQEARQKAEEAQRERIQKRIDNLNKEKDKINEVFQKRIEALNEELQIAESFAQLTESIRQTLDSILFSPESVLTGVEQVNALQSNIANSRRSSRRLWTRRSSSRSRGGWRRHSRRCSIRRGTRSA
jgi:DNA repair exonuclease SbcCD ATPase subunit